MKKRQRKLLALLPLLGIGAYFALRPQSAAAAIPWAPAGPQPSPYPYAPPDTAGTGAAVAEFFGTLFDSLSAPSSVPAPATWTPAYTPSAPTPAPEGAGWAFDPWALLSWIGDADDSHWSAEPVQWPKLWESWDGAGDDSFWSWTPTTQTDVPMNPQQNLNAFLRMIRDAEHSGLPYSDADRYRAMFGGTLIDNLEDHPRQRFEFRQTDGKTNYTTAAGAYQFIVPTWDSLRSRLRLPDFSPASQDAAAVELIRESGALNDVLAGRFDSAVMKLGRIWASLPTSTAPQHTRSWNFVRDSYASAGGDFA